MTRTFLYYLAICALIAASNPQELQKLRLKRHFADNLPYTNERRLDNDNSEPMARIRITLEYSITLDSGLPMMFIISSHDTGFSNGICPPFIPYDCMSPACTEDTSISESLDYGLLATTGASRLALNDEEITVGNGTWKLTTSPLYIHNCNYSTTFRKWGEIFGWIGLGLGMGANNNYQMTNPMFSIWLDEAQPIGELVFGFDPIYADSSIGPLVLKTDADWKIQVVGLSLGDYAISNSPATITFSIQSSAITLSLPLYEKIKEYFSKISQCGDGGYVDAFNCVFLGFVKDLPDLIFTSQDGTQFLIPPEVYTGPNNNVYIPVITFGLLRNSTPGKDFIIFGSQMMHTRYTVFQQLPNLTHTVSLYSYPPGIFDPFKNFFNDSNPTGINPVDWSSSEGQLNPNTDQEQQSLLTETSKENSNTIINSELEPDSSVSTQPNLLDINSDNTNTDQEQQSGLTETSSEDNNIPGDLEPGLEPVDSSESSESTPSSSLGVNSDQHESGPPNTETETSSSIDDTNNDNISSDQPKESSETTDMPVEVEDKNRSSHTVTVLIGVVACVIICFISVCLRRSWLRNKQSRKDSKLLYECSKDELMSEISFKHNEETNEEI